PTSLISSRSLHDALPILKTEIVCHVFFAPAEEVSLYALLLKAVSFLKFTAFNATLLLEKQTVCVQHYTTMKGWSIDYPTATIAPSNTSWCGAQLTQLQRGALNTKKSFSYVTNRFFKSLMKLGKTKPLSTENTPQLILSS